MSKIKIALFMFAVLLCPSTWAGSFELYLENDAVTPSNTDDSYSHGTKFTLYRDGAFNKDGTFVERGNGLAQFMYTPKDLSSTDIQYGERPYAGVLYLSDLTRRTSKKKQTITEVQVGAVGSYSFAEETQTKVHEWTDSQTPMGWDNQIGDEVFVNASHKVSHVLRKYKYMDFMGGYGGALGNLYVGANVDVVVRFGLLKNSFLPPQIEPVYVKKETELYGYVRANERFVAYNMTIDGSLFDDEIYTADSKPMVTELEGGIHLERPRFFAQFGYIGRSDEYEGQDERHVYGSLKVGNKW